MLTKDGVIMDMSLRRSISEPQMLNCWLSFCPCYYCDRLLSTERVHLCYLCDIISKVVAKLQKKKLQQIDGNL